MMYPHTGGSPVPLQTDNLHLRPCIVYFTFYGTSSPSFCCGPQEVTSRPSPLGRSAATTATSGLGLPRILIPLATSDPLLAPVSLRHTSLRVLSPHLRTSFRRGIGSLPRPRHALTFLAHRSRIYTLHSVPLPPRSLGRLTCIQSGYVLRRLVCILKYVPNFLLQDVQTLRASRSPARPNLPSPDDPPRTAYISRPTVSLPALIERFCASCFGASLKQCRSFGYSEHRWCKHRRRMQITYVRDHRQLFGRSMRTPIGGASCQESV